VNWVKFHLSKGGAKQLFKKVGQNNFFEKLGKTTFQKSWAKNVKYAVI